MTVIEAIFTGGLGRLPGGQTTGIFKAPRTGSVEVTATGLVGDAQGDTRVHGGPEKAVHLFPVDHYAVLASHQPSLTDQLVPGSLGENLSTRGLLEDDVCVGDIFTLGTAVVQVSQLRRPCWRIDAKLGTNSSSLREPTGDFRGSGPMVPLINRLGCTGWYFRVLQPGHVQAGQTIALAERPSSGITLARLHAADTDPTTGPAELRAIAAAVGLTPKVAQRLRERAERRG